MLLEVNVAVRPVLTHPAGKVGEWESFIDGMYGGWVAIMAADGGLTGENK